MSDTSVEPYCDHPAAHVVVGAGGRASCRDCGRDVAIVLGSKIWTAAPLGDARP